MMPGANGAMYRRARRSRAGVPDSAPLPPGMAARLTHREARTAMNKVARLSVIIAALFSTACFHAVVETGLTPSSHVERRYFRLSFLYGFIAPRPISVAEECVGGVARVETFHTGFEMLLAWATAGIFTPMSIRVTCAASGTSVAPGEHVLNDGQGGVAPQPEAIARAASRSAESGHSVYVRF